MTILLVIAILVLLIVAHELGHFIAAKIFKVRVEEFGVGYPPRAFLFGKVGDTEYTFNWLPFGGFVRLFGDEGEGQHGQGSFVDAKRGVQAAVLVAGVIANIIAAYFLFAGAFALGIPRVVDDGSSAAVHLVIADVIEGSPANAAGLTPGDEIVSVSDESGSAPQELSPRAVIDFVRERGGEPLLVTYARAGATSSATLRPAHAVIANEAGRPAIGLALVLVSNEPLPPAKALKESLSRTRDGTIIVAKGLWTIIRDALSGSPNLSEVVGPVGLVSVVSDAATHGVGNLLALAGFISINLAIINLIPIPALDGGRLVLLGLETVMRRSAPRLVAQAINALGVFLIVFLMIAVTYQDIARLLS
ncbi:MAG: Site-2 protease, Metallo peptidase, MEROPS family M50B [Parcubacteria group bacterium GW2011_GWA2_51_10]|nr:MAG: Site-2 protease, Metallo peptidase, MEROPS family M50B [Parcubacteria group bacterium GW2011_GWA2_51_10]